MNTKEYQEVNFRAEIRTLMVRHNLSTAKIARAPEVNLNAGTLYHYLEESSEMTGKNIEKVLNYLKSLNKKGK